MGRGCVRDTVIREIKDRASGRLEKRVKKI